MSVRASAERKLAALQREILAQQELLRALKVVESHGIAVGETSPRKAARRPTPAKPVLVRQPKKVKLSLPQEPKAAPRKLLARRHGRLTWTDGMWRVLQEQTTGISYDDLKAILLKGELGQNPSKGLKGFYQAILRLDRSGDIVKNGGLLYTAKLAAALKDRGKPLPVRIVGRGGTGSIVLGILNDHPQGLSGPELQEKAAQHPDAPSSMRLHRHYIYNVLGGLQGDGLVTKHEGIYRLAKSQAASAKPEEPPARKVGLFH